MKPTVETRKDESGRLALFADLFHAINQPLTSLRCSLELATQQARTESQYQQLVKDTLDQVEQVAELISGVREIIEADDPGENPKVLALCPYLQETVEELLPVAESRNVKLCLHYRSLPSVLAEPRRFRHALFHFLEGAIEAAEPGSVVNLEATLQRRTAVIELSSATEEVSSENEFHAMPGEAAAQQKMRFLWWRVALAIAARTFEAAGAEVKLVHSERRLQAQVTLPLASVD